MSKPWIHAASSARRFGGKPEDYIEIHNLMDSSKAVIADSRHRALTHNSWFIGTILEKVFGTVFVNSDGKTVSTRDIGEQHVLEDYGNRFIPSAQDFLQEMEFKEWMLSGKGTPPSFAKLAARKTKKKETADECDGEVQDSKGSNEGGCRGGECRGQGCVLGRREGSI